MSGQVSRGYAGQYQADERAEWKGRVPLEQDPASCLEGHLTFLLSQEKPLSAVVKVSKSGFVQG